MYNILVFFYQFALRLASPFNSKARKIMNGRKKSFGILAGMRDNDRSDGSVIWVHCASLGEFEQARPVIEAVKNHYPESCIYLSFFSSSGYEVRKDYNPAAAVFYLPADNRQNANKLLSLLAPDLVMFIKYEFWYHYLAACHQLGIPLISVSTILRPDHAMFAWYGAFYRKILHFFDHFYVQNHETRNLLIRHGIKNVTVSGDTRFDRVFQISRKVKELPLIRDFATGKRLIVLGSSWRPDIELWKEYINNAGNETRFVIAPHHIDEPELRYIERQITVKVSRYSNHQQEHLKDHKVLIIDNIGLLSSIYAYADMVYVGGSFSEGLHNILEPAAYGKPILIGKAATNRKYQEAVDLIGLGGALEISDRAMLKERADRLLADRAWFDEMAIISRKYVEEHTGATVRIMGSIKKYLG